MNHRDNDDATASDYLSVTVDAMADQKIAFLWFAFDKDAFEEYVGETITEREWESILDTFFQLHQPLDDEITQHICGWALHLAREECETEVQSLKTVNDIRNRMERADLWGEDEELARAVSKFLEPGYGHQPEDTEICFHTLRTSVRVLMKYGDVYPAYYALLNHVREKMLEECRPHEEAS